MKEIYLDIIFIICLIVIFMGGVFLSDDIKLLFHSKVKSVSSFSVCDNLTLEDTAYCLRNYVSTFYNYDNTGNDKFKGLDYIIENGGDCSDYSQLYEKLGDSLGFYSEYVVIDVSNVTAHAVVFLSEDSGYCLLDLTQKPYCVKF